MWGSHRGGASRAAVLRIVGVIVCAGAIGAGESDAPHRVQDDRERHVSAFHALVHDGLVDPAAAMLDASPDLISALRERGDETPLMTAVRSQREVGAMIDFLIERGGDVSATNRDGQTPLILAAAFGRVETAMRLIDSHGASLDARDRDQRTALMHAARSGHPDMIRFLSERGADAAARDVDGWSILHHAAWSADENILRACLDLSPGLVNEADKLGRTPIAIAARRGNGSSVRVLLASGADPTKDDEAGRTPLMEAAGMGEESVLAALLETTAVDSAHVNASDAFGRTALAYAATAGEAGAVARLLAAGANAGAQDKRGETALFYAIDARAAECVNELIDASDLSHRNQAGEHAVLLAAATGDAALLDLFLSDDRAAALLNVPDHTGHTPLMAAAIHGSQPCLEALMNHSADHAAVDDAGRTALMFAAQSRDATEAINVLLERASDIDAADQDGDTPLHHAARRGRAENIAAILDRFSGTVSIDARNAYDETPLMLAARSGSADAVRMLMEHGAASAVADDRGKTPLMFAARYGDAEIVGLLIEADRANINAKDSFGRTALVHAVIAGDRDRVSALLGAGADLTIEDNEKRTVDHYARSVTLPSDRERVQAALRGEE